MGDASHSSDVAAMRTVIELGFVVELLRHIAKRLQKGSLAMLM